jgi:hypothetical protein
MKIQTTIERVGKETKREKGRKKGVEWERDARRGRGGKARAPVFVLTIQPCKPVAGSLLQRWSPLNQFGP